MKKILTFGLLIFFLFSSASVFCQKVSLSDFNPAIKNGKVITSSENIIGNITSILTQLWIPDSWVDQSRILYIYNGGLIAEASFDSLVNGNWKTYGSMIIEYDNNNNLIRDISNFYESDGTLAYAVKWEYQYSGEKMSEGQQFMWDVDQSKWESYKKEVYTYSGELITKIEDYDDMGDGSWELASETAYQYDGENREIESLTRLWVALDNEFVNSDLTLTEYYKDLKMSSWYSRLWDLENNQWSEDYYTLAEYKYDANDNCIEEETTVAIGMMGFSFLAKSKLTNSYDANNYCIETIDYTWDEFSSEYLPVMKSEITNSSEGLPEVIIDYIYSIGEWVKGQKHIYTYDGTVAVDTEIEIPNEMVLNQNFPNPFNPTTTISYILSDKGFVEVDIYNILGKQVKNLVSEYQSAGNYEIRFNGENLASGTYIYQLKSSGIVMSKTCILLK